MPFNALTYYANKNRREAWRYLAQARDIKARSAAGTAYEWEKPRIKTMVDLARNAMRISLNYRRIAEIDRR
jgi:hypothetical protein